MFRRRKMLWRWQGPFGWLQRLVLGAGEKEIGRSLTCRRKNLPGAGFFSTVAPHRRRSFKAVQGWASILASF
jgi:hypothetical protein